MNKFALTIYGQPKFEPQIYNHLSNLEPNESTQLYNYDGSLKSDHIEFFYEKL